MRQLINGSFLASKDRPGSAPRQHGVAWRVRSCTHLRSGVYFSQAETGSFWIASQPSARSRLKTAPNPQKQAVPGHRSQVPTLHSVKCTSAQSSNSWQDSRALFHFCASEVVEAASTPIRLREGFRPNDGDFMAWFDTWTLRRSASCVFNRRVMNGDTRLESPHNTHKKFFPNPSDRGP